ncbi:hypothetical protein ACPOLB_12645 [Rubrivivax sp. RP6-9]|uniref:hypothetical protein n=1 Tax=Rubrivivax sp. RP6-9 TaxID=3415750 RepID=UPI003CC67E8F
MDRARPAASSSAPASAPASTAAWAARVAAWHNRHPLAARITPAQVQDLGVVDLPFSAREAATRRHWRAVFSDNLLPPYTPAQIARWTLRHGLEQRPRDAGQPVRQVPIDRRQLPPEGLALVLWVGTAAIHDAQGERTRVLLALQAPHAVLGQRLWSLQRVAVAALAGLALVTAPVLMLLRTAAQDAAAAAPPVAAAASAVLPPGLTPAVAAVLAAASAASSASAATAAAPAASAAVAALGADDLVAPDVAATPPATSSATPPAVPPPPGPFPPRRPLLDEASKILAQQELASARAAQAAAHGLPVFALVSRQVRTQAESEQLGAALQQALVNTEAPRGLRVDAMPAGRTWRAVGWPFLERGDAERVQQQLAARGQRVDLVAF